MPGREAEIEFDWLLSADGRSVSAEGRNAPAALPHAETVVAVMGESDVSWRRVELPKAGRQMRAALAASWKKAAARGARAPALRRRGGCLPLVTPPGSPSPPALAGRAPRAFGRAQIFVDRVLPRSAPDLPPGGHFHDASPDGTGQVELSWTQADGLASLPLGGQMASNCCPRPAPKPRAGRLRLASLRWLNAGWRPIPCRAVTSVHWRRWPRAGTCANSSSPQGTRHQGAAPVPAHFPAPPVAARALGPGGCSCSNWQG